MSIIRLSSIAALAATAILTVTACSTSAADSNMTVKDAWARPAAAGADTAVYFTIINGKTVPDVLVGVSTDAAQSASLHQTTTDASGMTGMEMIPQVTIPAGGTVQFAPGGYHVMLVGLKQELKVGDQVKVTLTFEQAGVVQVTALVKAS